MKNLNKIAVAAGMSLLILGCKDDKNQNNENHKLEVQKELAINNSKEISPPYTLQETIYVDRLSNNDYKLTLKKSGDWNVFSGISTEEIIWETPVKLSSERNDVVFKNDTPTKRLFFAAVKENDTIYLSEREIDLENEINFRDIGGIETTEGKYTKWGMIYRSGDLDELTPKDLAYMEGLGLKTILDLRTNEEIESKPDMYPSSVNWKHLPIGDFEKNGAMKEMMKIFMKADPETFNADVIMTKTSEQFVKSTDNFKAMFNDLLNDETPLLFHCTAGKDRTGHSSAFILRALGVDKETAINEYLLSNYFRYNSKNDALVIASSEKYGIDPRIMKQMMEVRRTWIEAAFTAIDENYGSFDNYLVEGLGITPEKQAKLKAKFLQ